MWCDWMLTVSAWCDWMLTVSAWCNWMLTVSAWCDWMLTVSAWCDWMLTVSAWCDWMLTVSAWCDWMLTVLAWCDWMLTVSAWCDWMLTVSAWCDWMLTNAASFVLICIYISVISVWVILKRTLYSVTCFHYCSLLGKWLESCHMRAFTCVIMLGVVVGKSVEYKLISFNLYVQSRLSWNIKIVARIVQLETLHF